MAVRRAVASILLGLVVCTVPLAAQSNGSSLRGAVMNQTVETFITSLPEVQKNATSNASLPESSLEQMNATSNATSNTSLLEEVNLNVGGWRRWWRYRSGGGGYHGGGGGGYYGGGGGGYYGGGGSGYFGGGGYHGGGGWWR
ncbi:unnamed protein product [Polarella glacialis]|uniref:Uncharacterized protein n=1 Tax=Polarella glacialis TaxID=89957 RepID=A0A813ISY6_POLGL|nr:unnamed protein product [Polarella glacialis]